MVHLSQLHSIMDNYYSSPQTTLPTKRITMTKFEAKKQLLSCHPQPRKLIEEVGEWPLQFASNLVDILVWLNWLWCGRRNGTTHAISTAVKKKKCL
jgi:hypothetical protein